MMPQNTLSSSPRRSLACLGDAADIRAWSNIPFYLFNAARTAGFLTDALDLMEPRYRFHRFLWQLAAPLRLERPRGYQYSRIAVERMWDCVPPACRVEGAELVSHFQVFPPLHRVRQAGVRHSFYCDATLRQLVGDGSPGVGWRTWRDTLGREGELYRSARFFIGMSRAAVASAIEQYGVDPARAHVVRPGANMDETVVGDYLARRGESWRASARFTKKDPAILGFIGMNWQRKGLSRLLGAAERLAQRGRPVKLLVIGGCPPQWQNHPLVEYAGIIRKQTELHRFIETVDRFALGCLPSEREPLGISTLECLRLGVPVMGSNVGGIPDCIPPEGGFLVPARGDAAAIADAVEAHLFDESRYGQMVRGAEREMPNVTWARTVEQLAAIWVASLEG